MKHVAGLIVALSVLALSVVAQENIQVDINITGKVTDKNGKGLSDANVTLVKSKLSKKTDAQGNFSLVFDAAVDVLPHSSKFSKDPAISIQNSALSIHMARRSAVTISVYSVEGRVLAKMNFTLHAGRHRIPVPVSGMGVSIYKVELENREVLLKNISLGEQMLGGAFLNQSRSSNGALAKQTAPSIAFADVLKVTKSGYDDFSMNITDPKKSGIVIKLNPLQTGLILPQEGNPVHKAFDRYKGFMNRADNILSHQFDCGGWTKGVNYGKAGKGGDGLGTFDNGATTMEMTVMAAAYKETGQEKYLNSARKAIDYVFKAQYPSGGWPQFYPFRGGYSDHVTFNDDAMSRVLTVLQHAYIKTPPFDTDVLTAEQRSKLRQAIDGGVDYILKAQIVQNGKKTAWCAQHGKDDYKPKRARAYEHPSISGSESVGIIGFLMTQPQTPEIKESVIAALDWFRSPDTYTTRKGKKEWFRFYDIATNKPIFSNYDGKIWIGIEHEGKKKASYSWSGGYGNAIISYAEKVGY